MNSNKSPNIEANVISVRDFFNLGSFDIPHYQKVRNQNNVKVVERMTTNEV
jgi:hypothetical protein